MNDDLPTPALTWEGFCAHHAELFARSRLSDLITDSHENWVDFLKHGYLDAVEDPDDFTVEELDEDAYAALRQLTHAYFEMRVPFFVPIALRTEDYMELARRYAGADTPKE